MTEKITIIGAGPGGYVAAVRAAQLGAEVTLIEKDNVGGTCLNWGCIPSKIMIKTAEMLTDFKKAQEFGLSVSGEVRADIKRLMARKHAVIDSQTKGILALLKHHKVRYLKGDGYIKRAGLAALTPTQGDVLEVAWDKLILATGTRPFEIPTLPFDGQKVISSNEALCLEEIPQSILIVGGGVIGCEFACMLSALGADVTVVEALERLLPLPSVDEDCSKVLQREMKKRRIAFALNRTVKTFDQTGGKLRVTIEPSPFLKNPSEKDKKPQTVDVDQILVCIGRKPNTAGIGLENIGLPTDERGWIAADERMQTAAAGVFAIGDVLGPAKVMLAHVASSEGLVAAENAMGARRVMDYRTVPGAIFTMPEVATVGWSEKQARDQARNVRADSVLFRTLGKAQVIGEISGQAKIVSDADTREILGVHIIGPHATDLIAEATLAMQMGATTADLAATIHAHPTLAEIMLEASFKALDRSLHG